MTCSACSSRVEKCVRGLEGVEEVSVNLLTNSMVVQYDENTLNENGIVTAVEKAGYGASPADNVRKQTAENTGRIAGSRKKEDNPAKQEQQKMKQR